MHSSKNEYLSLKYSIVLLYKNSMAVLILIKFRKCSRCEHAVSQVLCTVFSQSITSVVAGLAFVVFIMIAIPQQ